MQTFTVLRMGVYQDMAVTRTDRNSLSIRACLYATCGCWSLPHLGTVLLPPCKHPWIVYIMYCIMVLLRDNQISIRCLPYNICWTYPEAVFFCLAGWGSIHGPGGWALHAMFQDEQDEGFQRVFSAWVTLWRLVYSSGHLLIQEMLIVRW